MVKQLHLTEMPCGVQLEPCHDLAAWLLSSASYGGWGEHHGSHGDGGDHGSHGYRGDHGSHGWGQTGGEKMGF